MCVRSYAIRAMDCVHAGIPPHVNAGKQSCDIVVVLRRWDVCEKGAIKVYFGVVEVRVGWVELVQLIQVGPWVEWRLVMNDGGVFLDITSKYSAPEARNIKSL